MCGERRRTPGRHNARVHRPPQLSSRLDQNGAQQSRTFDIRNFWSLRQNTARPPSSDLVSLLPIGSIESTLGYPVDLRIWLGMCSTVSRLDCLNAAW
jgi:hypothetical protein